MTSLSDGSDDDDRGDVSNSPSNSFQLPPRNPILENFVNATDAQNYVDPATALTAAESRCVGLVASAESFAQQRHAKLQQLFKRIQMTNNEEVSDLSGRVAICEAALQELSGLLEHVQLHIQSASAATHEFIRGCTVDRSKAEGRLLTSLNSMLVQYEQQRRTWRRQAAEMLIRQDLAGMQTGLEAVCDCCSDDDDDDDEQGGDDHEEQQQGHFPRMGFLALEVERSNDQQEQEEATPTAATAARGGEQQPNNNNSAATDRSSSNPPAPPSVAAAAQQQTPIAATNSKKKKKTKKRELLRYMPAAVREKRKTILQRFAATLGQMLIDGDTVDRPFLLDATYARVIRYADVLTLQGETICRHVAEMFHDENARRNHFLLSGERAIFRRNAEALCPPNLVPIGDEPVYTVFVQKLVEHRLEREVKCLTMMDAGLDDGKQQMQQALEGSLDKFTKALQAVLKTVTRHGVMMLHPDQVPAALSFSTADDAGGGGGVTSSNMMDASFAGSAISNASIAGGAGGASGGGASTTPRYRDRTRVLGSTFGGGSIGAGGGSIGAGGGSFAGTDANVAAIVSRLLSASFGDSLAEPHSTDDAVRKAESGAMQRVFYKLLDEVATTLRETHDTLSTGFHETIAAVQPSPINLINNPTVFSLDALKSELSHQALLLKVASASEGSERSRLVDELKQERQKSNTLQHSLDDKSRQLITLEAAHATKDAELHDLETAVRTRSKSYVNLRREIKRINYQLTSDAFGKGWQESILMLRESMIRQMLEESSSLLSKVKHYQKQKFDEQERVVKLLESGFLATSDSIEHDQASKLREAEARHKVEMQRVRDECELRVKNAHLDAKDEIKLSREMFEGQYRDRVNELNTAYDEKVRQVEQRQRDWEDRLWDKMKQIRADFREKEVLMERQYAAKHEAVLRIYEDEANTLKKNINEKEAQLESERLSVHLEIEKQITEGVAKVKDSYEIVRAKLQHTMLDYLADQRTLFDGQRQEELQLFSDFAFGGMKHAKNTAFGIVETNRKTFQNQVEESQKSVQDATLSANDVTGRLLKHRDELHENRLSSIRGNNEQVLRKTQLVRIEQDEKTWNQIHKEIVTKAAELDRKQAQTEELMTQRYVDIVKSLHGYIQGDVNAAHQTFERECQFRQEQLRNYINHFHNVSLHIESELWHEANARNDIEREAMSILNLLMSRSRTEAEYLMRNAIIQGHISTLNTDAEETTFTTVEALRARYEGLLRRQHQLMGAMSHDYVSSVQHYVHTQNATAEASSAVFAARLDEMHSALRSRWELHWASRDMIVERTLEGLVHTAAVACRELLGGALNTNKSSSFSSPSSRRRSPIQAIESSPFPQTAQGGSSSAAPPPPAVGSTSSSSAGARHNDMQPDSSYENAPTSTPSVTFVMSGGGGGGGAAAADGGGGGGGGALVPSSVSGGGSVVPPLFYAQDVRVVEYFTSIKELLSKTFEQLEAKITAGNEEREAKLRQMGIDMRARFMDAASALTRRAEQLEDKVLHSKMENNSLQAQLQLKSEAEIRAATLADDLKALVGHYRLLTQNVLIHGAFNAESQQQQHQPMMMMMGGGGGGGSSPVITAGGGFRRQQLLGNQNTNTSTFGNTTTAGNKNSNNNNMSQFQATFVLDVGGKKATRDVVMENALLRERLLATEWKNDKFLKDAMMSSNG